MLLAIYFTTKEDAQGRAYEDCTLTLNTDSAARDVITDYFYNDGKIDLAQIIVDLFPFQSVEFQKVLFDGFIFSQIESFSCELYKLQEGDDIHDFVLRDRWRNELIAKSNVYYNN